MKGPPLLQIPILDPALIPPAIVMDGMHVVKSSTTTIQAVLSVIQILTVRGIIMVLHPIARLVKADSILSSFASSWGKSLNRKE